MVGNRLGSPKDIAAEEESGGASGVGDSGDLWIEVVSCSDQVLREVSNRR
jgi:hypothetical protein